MASHFFTNQEGNSLLKKFEGVFEFIPSLRYFDALVGYLRASGYFKVRPFLDNIHHIRILVGINVDKLFQHYYQKGQAYIENVQDTKEAFLEEMAEDIQNADYDKETEQGMLQFLDDLYEGKIELRSHPKQKIHAKLYIFRGATFNEHAPCNVITGSSNLTDAGLGANPESNYEFNVELRDYDNVKFALDEFNQLWEESVPVLKDDAGELRKRTYLRKDITPFDLYIRMLLEYFGKRVEYDPYNINLLLPDNYMPLKYQSDAANQGYAMMLKHNGFILADVVGLGKTIVALMIAKKFIYENGTHTRILVVAKPAMKTGWQETAEHFQIRHYMQVITNGSLHKVFDENNLDYAMPGKYDMIIVDEAHKFRNTGANRYEELQKITKFARENPAENGDARKKIMLVSATPLNNAPRDIENLLYLFQDRRNSTLENIQNLQEYFKPINKKYAELAHEPELNLQSLKKLFDKIREDVIEQLVIRRTRTDIQQDKDYMEDIKKQGLRFPDVQDPEPLYYTLDADLTELFHRTVEKITGLDEDGNEVEGLGYYRYRAIEYLKREEDRKIYGQVENISNRLAAIMRTLLVKRLESSFFAFKNSLKRAYHALENMIAMLDNDRVFIAPDLDINTLIEEGKTEEEILEKVTARGNNNREFAADAFDKTYRELLQKDMDIMEDLLSEWNELTTDPKLDAFKEAIANRFFNHGINPTGKLVIFTESKETAYDLKQALEISEREDVESAAKLPSQSHNVLMVSADNRDELTDIIARNFDANYKGEKQDEYNVIITTEVLAEGINLHRSNVVVNYDVPWNATRLMQRIGRVNRIGSEADKIYVFNYYPSAEGDEQINLVNRALRKLQAFHTAFGEDNRIFSLLEEKGEGGLFGSEIRREESESLKYLRFLRDFRKKHPERYRRISSLPGKSRCARNSQTPEPPVLQNADLEPVSVPLANTSIAYLKGDNHPGIFCLVTPEGRTTELSFLQAAAIFAAKESEQPLHLHEKHHQQVIAALDYFKSTQSRPEKKQNRTQLSPIEKTATKNLHMLQKHAPTEQKRNTLIRAKQQIQDGKFVSKGLPKKIAVFYKANSNRIVTDKEAFYNELFTQILDQYDFRSGDEDKLQNRGLINPRIIITESFH